MIKEKHPWKQSIEDHDDVYADGYNMVSQPVNAEQFLRQGRRDYETRASGSLHCLLVARQRARLEVVGWGNPRSDNRQRHRRVGRVAA